MASVNLALFLSTSSLPAIHSEGATNTMLTTMLTIKFNIAESMFSPKTKMSKYIKKPYAQ